MTNPLQRSVALALCVIAPIVVAQSRALEIFKVTEGDALITNADPGIAKLAECQPAKGNHVAAQERKQLAGTTMLRVTVLDGACKGAMGWVGIHRVEAVPEQP